MKNLLCILGMILALNSWADESIYKNLNQIAQSNYELQICLENTHYDNCYDWYMESEKKAEAAKAAEKEKNNELTRVSRSSYEMSICLENMHPDNCYDWYVRTEKEKADKK